MSRNQYSIEKAYCINCGRYWGGHSGIDCSIAHVKIGKTFEPIGYSLSDICEICGETLDSHDRRYYCKRRKPRQKNIFTKNRDMFQDGDFLL